MLLLNRNWNETKHFQMSPDPPPQSGRLTHYPGLPSLQRRGFVSLLGQPASPKITPRESIVYTLLNHPMYSKMAACKKRQNIFKMIFKKSCEVTSMTRVLRLTLRLPCTLTATRILRVDFYGNSISIPKEVETVPSGPQRQVEKWWPPCCDLRP